jgi:hypothetical protein
MAGNQPHVRTVTAAEDRDREMTFLLDHLARLNKAYRRAGAVPDLTVKEAQGFVSVAALRISVEASEHRLSKILSGEN